jgi:hypothetical protein
MYSGAFRIANASAWLLVHLLSIMYISFAVGFPGHIMAMPAPTPCFDLLPSV